MGVGAKHCPPGLHALWGLPATGLVGGRPPTWLGAVRPLWGGSVAFVCQEAGLGGGGAARAPCPPFVRPGGPVGRGVALPRSVPLPSLGRQQRGCHRCRSGHGGRGPHTTLVLAHHTTGGTPEQRSSATQDRSQPRATTGDQATATGAAARSKNQAQHTHATHKRAKHKTHHNIATQHATTHKERGQPRNTQPHSASAHRPPPGHNAYSNTHQHTPQPRRHKPAKAPHNGHTEAEKKRQERKRKSKQTKNRSTASKQKGGGVKEAQKKRPRTPETRERQKKASKGGEGRREDHKTPRPKAPWAGKQGKLETTGAQQEEKNALTTTTNRAKQAWRGPNKQRAHQDRPQERMRRTKKRPGGRSARPGQ